jgi:hypothetical protein
LVAGGAEGSSDPAAKAGETTDGMASADIRTAAAIHFITDWLIVAPVRPG